MKSGKYSLGYKTVLRSLRNSKGSFLFSGSSFFFFFAYIYSSMILNIMGDWDFVGNCREADFDI